MMLQGSSNNHRTPEDSPQTRKIDGKKLASTISSGDWKKGNRKEAESDVRNKKDNTRMMNVTQNVGGNSHSDGKTKRPDKSREMGTVDRGVGPTPTPNIDQRMPPYFGLSPYMHDRRTALESAYPFLYSPVPYPFNHPIPVNSSTNEGRYHWPPFQHPSGAEVSPTFPDLSPRSPFGGGGGADSVSAINSRLHWEQYQRAATAMQFSPFFYHNRFSPTGLAAAGYRDAYLVSGEAFIPPLASLSHRSMFSELPASLGSGSITLPGSLDGSRLASPRPSVMCNKSNRKRALSHSPVEYGLDIESVTRSSEGSLHLPAFGPGSRTSSNASGSYGHLSAASLTAFANAAGPLAHPFFRHHGAMPVSPFYPMLHPGMFPWPPVPAPGIPAMAPSSTEVSSTATTGPKSEVQHNIIAQTATKEPGSSIVSSTVHSNDVGKIKMKKEEEYSPVSDLLSEDMRRSPESHQDPNHVPQEGEPDFYETQCHWKGCTLEFDTQEELVRHLNQDHLSTSKKLYVCHWNSCERKEKPFKAQYMLVVHMRRHTGEKPHRCTFEGCHKAYSRLENLKTHLRSHTGEKPYMCEYQGCTKAFSNASDRAKHQNRTHSNAKPYTCKAPGCTKCYTDPSSLRKHVKTVHGADFYANKKHKGDFCHGNDSDNGYRGYRGTSVRNHTVGDDRKPDLVNSNSNSSTSSSSHAEDTGQTLAVSQASPAERSHVTDSEASLASPLSLSSQSVHSPPDDRLQGTSLSCHVTTGLVDEFRADSFRNTHSSSEHLPTTDGDEEIGSVLAHTVSTVNFQGSSGIQVATAGVIGRQVKTRHRLHPKCRNLPTLPPIGNTRRVTTGDLNPKITDVKVKGTKDVGARLSQRDLTFPNSYTSSIRSNTSPCSFSSTSLRRLSETSSNSSQRSILRSPYYEYDYSSSASDFQHQFADSGANIGALASHMERTKLGGSNTSNNCSFSRGSITRFLASHRESSDSGIRTNTSTTTPCQTPLPTEIPPLDVRRASDPARWDGNEVSPLAKPFHRCNSLNTVRPLPIPPRTRLVARRSPAGSNLMSSNSSIATNFSNQSVETNYESSVLQTESKTADGCSEENLTQKLQTFDFDEEFLIPDDMQDFLNKAAADAAAVASASNSADCTMPAAHAPSESKPLIDAKDHEPRNSCMYEHNSLVAPTLGNGSNWTEKKELGVKCSAASNETLSLAVDSGNCSNTDLQKVTSRGTCQSCGGTSEEDDTALTASARFHINNAQTPNRRTDGSIGNSLGTGLHQSIEGPRFSNQWFHTRPRSGRMGVSPGEPVPGFDRTRCSGPMIDQTQNTMVAPFGNSCPSPRVQVPHISQSQVSPQAKTPNSRRNPHAAAAAEQMRIASSNIAIYPNEHLLWHRGEIRPSFRSQHGFQESWSISSVQNNGFNVVGMHPPVNLHHMEINRRLRGSAVGTSSHPGFNTGELPPSVRPNYSHLSPNCNQVTSTTDLAQNFEEDTRPHFGLTVNSIDSSSFMDNLSSISIENIPPSPTLITNFPGGDQGIGNIPPTPVYNERAMPASYLNSCNMVVNDMSSVLSQLVEENKYLGIHG